ncbi:MAG: hypothetical protein L6Q54_08225 [Leptospiraceae bacterium]|nr:hypothetical protein [Leptospiraceae bacterium]MCK6381221.1 hypothetical protein [Leptospiraceae bacterium]NUM40744.1 hypothetical protein [Leptospiraceae bacterium]
MTEFDSIDLLNYATYGNDYDEEWEDIRVYIKSNISAQKELEELRKNLPAATKRKRDFIPERRPSLSTEDSTDSKANLPEEQKKGWWSSLLGGE